MAKSDPVQEAVAEGLRPVVGDAEEVVETTQVVVAHHVPGAPLETAADRAAREAVAAEPKGEDYRYEASTPDTTSAEANLASRDNIVSDGPGTVGALGS